MRFGHALVIERALFTGSASDGRVHPFLPFSIRHDARGCPILCCEARSFFLSFTAKGGITITVHAQEIAPGFPKLVMWRKDHRIPPFAKTKNAKDGVPSCVVAQAKVGHPPSSEVDGTNQKTPDEASSNPTPSAKSYRQDDRLTACARKTQPSLHKPFVPAALCRKYANSPLIRCQDCATLRQPTRAEA